MTPDKISENAFEEFGTFKPGPLTKILIDCAIRCCYSPPLKPLSSLCRRLVMISGGEKPVDYTFRGLKVRFYPAGNVAEKRGLLNPAAFDPAELDFMTRTLPPGGIFLDIGANVGLYSLTAATITGPGGRIIAFEPNPVVFRRLSCNITLNADRNDLGTINPLPLAVTDQTGYARFVAPASNLGEGRVAETSATGEDYSEVKSTTLLDALQAGAIDRIDIIKIDIEGGEMNALAPFFREAPPALHPQHIIIERGSEDHWQPLQRLLDQAGYRRTRSCPMNEILSRSG